MARFNVSGLDKMLLDMTRMGKLVSPVAEEMVNAAAEEIIKAWKIAADANGHHDTGALIASIGTKGPVKSFGDALYQDVYPQGKHPKAKGSRKTLTNAALGFILHYGTSQIPASHWVDDAEDLSSGPVQARLEAIWDRFLESGGK